MLYSVIIPAHRDDRYLVEAIRSVESAIGQDNAELIIVANGPERLRIQKRHGRSAPPNRRVIVSELPSLIHASNLGIEAARGEFIARMDSDDICLPDRFTRQIAAIRQSGADILFAEADDIGADGEPIQVRRARRQTYPVLPYWPIHPTAMIRRSALIALGGYGNIAAVDDRQLWLQAAAAGLRFHKLPAPVIRRRRHTAQMTAQGRARRMAAAIGLDVAFAIEHGRWDVLWRTLAQRIPRLLLFGVRSRFSHRKGQSGDASQSAGFPSTAGTGIPSR